ncbi:MAG: hypothetical protein NTW19_19445 [Planctomycetota bacterium]|nr:hypothetical protein [Planctomycetota bacterium]
MTKFVRLYSGRSTSQLGEWDDDCSLTDGVVCPLVADHCGTQDKLIPPLGVIFRKKVDTDFRWTWNSDCILTAKAIEVLRDEHVTGFEARPIRAASPRQALPPLWEMVVTGWGGMASEASGIQLTYRCPGCGHLKYSGALQADALVDESRWDGSDVFMVWPMPRFFLAAPRVTTIIRKHKLTGVRAVPLHKLNLRDGFTPGRLSQWMPEERARELGEPLDIE